MFHLIYNSHKFMAHPNIFEDDCTVKGYKKRPTQSLESEESAAEEEGLQECLVGDDIDNGQPRNIVLLSNNLLQLLHLRFDVILDSPEPRQSQASITLSASSHQPDWRLWQQPAETEEDDTEEAEGGVVEVDGDDQANTETQQKPNVVVCEADL